MSWVRLRNMSNPGLLAVGQFVFSGDPRLAVTRAANTSRCGATRHQAARWSLVIAELVLEDSGSYECQVPLANKPHTIS